MGPKRRRLEARPVPVPEPMVELEPLEIEARPASPVVIVTPQVVNEDSTDLVARKRPVVLPESFHWNPLVNIEVNKSTRNVSKYLTDFHQSREILRLENKKDVDEFFNKFKDRFRFQNDDSVSFPILYSRDGYDDKGENGTIIYPVLKLCGFQVSCLILNANLFLLEENYQLRAILMEVPNLKILSLKSGGDDNHEYCEKGEFPELKNLKQVEIVSHFYCGLPQKILEAYGSQLKSLALQDLDCPHYSTPPGCKDSLSRMVKALKGIEGMFSNVQELKICSLRNLSVLSTLSGFNSPKWNLKRLAVNVTMPNEQFKFSHFQMILNRFCNSLEEVHLDVFGHHGFVEAFFDWDVVRGRDYPEEALPRKVCRKLKVLSLPCLALVRYQVLGEATSKLFPKLESLTFLRWERKWPMKVTEYLGRPRKKDLAKVFKDIKKRSMKLKEIKALKKVSVENKEDIVWSKSFGKKKKANNRGNAKKGRGGDKTKNN